MAALGAITQRESGRDTIERARARAELIPSLLVEARRVANTVYSGWHGRRKRGVGENFWQFRPYSPGESMSRIDWRRSARDESHIFVQDKEWQATHTVWLWVDESPSMLFKSDMASVAKQSRALVLAFAMAELLAKSGERVGWLGLTKPILSRNAAEKLAEALILGKPQTDFPQKPELGQHSDQIVDPVEETFPYTGRVEFRDPETGEKFTAGNAETLKIEYEAEISMRTEAMRQSTNKLGWSFTRHHTDKLASEALVKLHTHLGERPL